MRYDLYILPFFLAFVVSAMSCAVFIYFFRKKNITDNRKQTRHIHNKNISRFGGVAVIMAFILAILLDRHLIITSQIAGLIFASLVIVAIGVWDDLRELGWKTQLFLQVITVGSMFFFGFGLTYISNPFGGIIYLDSNVFLKVFAAIFVVIWILLMTNAMNWIDGIDGLSGNITLIAVLAIFLLSLKPEVNQPPIAIIAVVLAGAIMGFLLFNFYPAKIFAGTSGAMFFGFILAMLSIIAGAKIATTLLVVAIPVIDALWVILERIKARESIFNPDGRHIHHRLLEFGWSQRKITIFFCITTMIVGIAALGTHAMGKALALLLSFALIIAAFFYLRVIVLKKDKKQVL